MRILQEFIAHHSTEDLLIIGFFMTLSASVVGWIIDVVLGKRGFGVIGNSILIFLGIVVGSVFAETQGTLPSVPEANRIIFLSTAVSALILALGCKVKAWRSVV